MPAPSPGSAGEALAAVRAGLDYLAGVTAADLTAAEQADCLRGLAACESVQLAVTSGLLSAFTAAGACADDGQATTRAWLRWQTRVTGAAAGMATAWMRRLEGHPRVAAALAAGRVSPSWARAICEMTDRFTGGERDTAGEILLGAAAGGADLPDLSGLAEEMWRRCAPPDTDPAQDRFGQRSLRLRPHFGGHARLDGDLTPDAATALRALLDAFNGTTGAEDTRTDLQRDHDALEEAARVLVAGGLPDRAGQPTQIQLHMTLHQLLGLPGADEATAAWVAASGTAARPGQECDALIVPMVTGFTDEPAARSLAAELYPPAAGPAPASSGPASPGHASPGHASLNWPGGPGPRAARQLTIAEAVRLLSGPGGLASWLRTHQLGGGPASTVSLPLDIGWATEAVPASLRRAVIRRDRHCRFPGCRRRPVSCHVHHLTARADGGTTSLDNCVLLCAFHHLTVIHRWGWTLTLQPDGTTTATAPGGRRTLRDDDPLAA